MTATDVDAEQPRPTSRRTPTPRPVPRGRLALLLGSGSLVLRVAGDIRGIGWAWQVGGAGNVMALLGFVGLSAVLVVRR